jgi:hypothetical protein
MSTLDRANNILDKVMDFYEKHGIAIGQRPTFGRFDKKHPTLPNIIAQAPDEQDAMEACQKLLLENSLRIYWDEAYSLRISEVAFKQMVDSLSTPENKKKLRDIFHSLDIHIVEGNEDADVLLYPPFEHIKPARQEETIAHELWHLIEIRRGLFRKNPLIAEGTATFAQYTYANKRCDTPIEEAGNFFEMIYHGSANLVQQAVSQHAEPIKALLSQTLRQEIETAFLTKFRGRITQTLQATLSDLEFTSNMKNAMGKSPLFKELLDDLSAEGIINFYTKLGATKLADELQKQDLRKMVADYQRFYGNQP